MERLVIRCKFRARAWHGGAACPGQPARHRAGSPAPPCPRACTHLGRRRSGSPFAQGKCGQRVGVPAALVILGPVLAGFKPLDRRVPCVGEGVARGRPGVWVGRASPRLRSPVIGAPAFLACRAGPGARTCTGVQVPCKARTGNPPRADLALQTPDRSAQRRCSPRRRPGPCPPAATPAASRSA